MKTMTTIALLFLTAYPAFAEDLRCSGKGCLDWPIPTSNSLYLERDDVLGRSCKGQGDRCQTTDECCEGNNCLVGDHPYATCGGG